MLGIDIDPHYLAQARWAAERFGLANVRFARRQLYELGSGERFDLILFMGVFYHLRYPLLALDLLARLEPQLMVFQTLTQGATAVSARAREDCDFATRDRLAQPDWPHLAFIETTFCGDPTNWWVPNRAAVQGMLRAAGFAVLARPGEETWLCTSAARAIGEHDDEAVFDAARRRGRELASPRRGTHERQTPYRGRRRRRLSRLASRRPSARRWSRGDLRRQLLHRPQGQHPAPARRTPGSSCCRHDITLPLYVEVDAIYNLACPASPIHYQRDPVQTLKTCVHGSINLLGLAKRLRVPILLASTSEVYGDPHVHPQTEDYWGHVNPIGRRSCYDEGKRCAETLFFDYGRQYRLPIKVARIFNTYGPRMHPQDGRVVSNFIVQALRGRGPHDLWRRPADALVLLRRRPDRRPRPLDGVGARPSSGRSTSAIPRSSRSPSSPG